MSQRTPVRALRSGRAWLQTYGRATFLARDAQGGMAVFVIVAVSALVSEGVRAQFQALSTVAIGVCGGLLGIVLGAMSVVTAFISRVFVAVVGDITRALMPFRTVAGVAAAGLLAGLVGVATVHVATTWVRALVLGAVAGITVWAVIGVVQLVGLVAYFATVRARELSAVMDAEKIFEQRSHIAA